MNIKQELLKYKEDKNFIDFNKKLISTKYEMLGVKIPNIRLLVKNVSDGEIKQILKANHTDTFEEILFKGFLLGKLKGEDELKEQILKLLPYIDNWCTCDTVVSSLKQLKKENGLFNFFVSLTQDNREYYSRFGFVAIKCYYLKEEYIGKILTCGKLSKFVQNKAVQKARESFRVDKTFKQELLKYKMV